MFIQALPKFNHFTFVGVRKVGETGILTHAHNKQRRYGYTDFVSKDVGYTVCSDYRLCPIGICKRLNEIMQGKHSVFYIDFNQLGTEIPDQCFFNIIGFRI